MRISTQQYFEASTAKYQSNYSSLVKAQDQTTSGVRVQTAADDPVAAARLLMLQQQKDMLGQFNGNIDTLTNSLANENGVLDNLNNALQKASELALQAGNIGISDADRKALADSIGSIQDQVLGLLNTKDASGNYMFSGSKTDTPPYTRNNDGTYTYQGDETPLSLKVAENLSISMGDTAKTILESSGNTGRTQATRVLPPPPKPRRRPVPTREPSPQHKAQPLSPRPDPPRRNARCPPPTPSRRSQLQHQLKPRRPMARKFHTNALSNLQLPRVATSTI